MNFHSHLIQTIDVLLPTLDSFIQWSKLIHRKHPTTNPNCEWWWVSIITFLQKDIMWYLYAGRSVILHINRTKSCTKGQIPKVKTTFTLLGAPLLWQWNVSCKCKSDFSFYGTQWKLIGNTILTSSWDITNW